ncbi:MAG: ATP-binding protein [Candidatus Heimdallarchaeota archaeon]|nr:MAG: ATP-binding protein [Candidatus Heimdallarchaeota archaeon]
MTIDIKKQITVLSGKGGTGKTTITAVLAQLSASISLLADCDVDAPNLHLLLNPNDISSERFMSGKIAIKNPERCLNCGKCLEVCRFDAVDPNFEINPITCEGCGFCAWVCPQKAITMEIKPSGRMYEAETRFGPMVHARLDIGAENSGKLVSEVIKRSHVKANQLNKNLVIVDGSPGIGCSVIAALTNAELVIIVVEPTTTAIHDMKRTIELVHFFNLTPAIIINKATINEVQRTNIVSYCREENIPILTELPYNLQIFKAMTNGKTILEEGINDLEKSLNEMWLRIQGLLQLNEG